MARDCQLYFSMKLFDSPCLIMDIDLSGESCYILCPSFLDLCSLYLKCSPSPQLLVCSYNWNFRFVSLELSFMFYFMRSEMLRCTRSSWIFRCLIISSVSPSEGFTWMSSWSNTSFYWRRESLPTWTFRLRVQWKIINCFSA